MTIDQYRIIINVFHSFGIRITGQRKHKSFVLNSQESLLFIQALIFELELQLGIYLEEKAGENFCCPQAIVSAIRQQKQASMILTSLEIADEKIVDELKFAWV